MTKCAYADMGVYLWSSSLPTNPSQANEEGSEGSALCLTVCAHTHTHTHSEGSALFLAEYIYIPLHVAAGYPIQRSNFPAVLY